MSFHPDELAPYNGLFYQLYDAINNVWTFSGGGVFFNIKMQGNQASNDGDVVRRWCVASKGLALKSCIDMSVDLLSGKVVSLMPNFKAPQTELWMVFPSRQSITPAARLLRDTLKEKSKDILMQLIEKGILDKHVLT